MMSAKYFEYYTIILRGAVFSWTHCSTLANKKQGNIKQVKTRNYLPTGE